MNNTETPNKKHEGRNVQRFRDLLGIKQEVLAAELGFNQQKMSFIEGKEQIDEELMQQIAAVLKVTPEAIRNFDEEQAINIISNTFDNGAFLNTGNSPTFNVNPVEKWMEALKKNEDLYDQLLKSEREKIALLEKLLAAKG